MQNDYRNTPLPPQPPSKIHPPSKKKFYFHCLKSDTCKSLNEVEFFLNNFSDFIRYTKLIKILNSKK